MDRRSFLLNSLITAPASLLAFPRIPSTAAPPSQTAFPTNLANPEGSSVDRLLSAIPIPAMAEVEIQHPRPILDSPTHTLRTKLVASGLLQNIRSGMSIAVGAGSRGIANLPSVTKALLDQLKEVGARPFLFPAMGSHGGATPAGQLAVLDRMGISEKSMGVPIKSSMDVVELGRTASGLPAYMDAHAAASDGVIVINRIKPHTAFRGRIESGLTKMIVIGAGKQKGAETCHNLGFHKMDSNLRELCNAILSSKKILFGVGLIENAYHETCGLEIVPGADIPAAEPALLEHARSLMPRVPLSPIDVLVIDEIGKDISGGGFDANVVGRYVTADIPLRVDDPRITRIAVLDISAPSDGNATGLGNADFTTERVLKKYNLQETYTNLLTSVATNSGRIPMFMRNDRQAIQAAIRTAHLADPATARVIRIRNTLSLSRISVSSNLIAEVGRQPNMRTLSEPRPMSFDNLGNLLPPQ